ncbi:MAG: hypothetical protein KatS3mg001_432 [Candidatus Pacearchaeota archaeon]|nr:MAG: hypothetical protein KatS3mg001_432 [Candidatus Pacearchaeota archaeon]
MKEKKAQIKIQQMAFMLIAVSLFFAIAGLFLLTFVFSGIKGSSELVEQREALLLVSKLSNSPEFSCGNAFERSEGNCIDSDKIMALKKYQNLYGNFWEVSGIEIRKVFPKSEEKIECTQENYPNCNSIIIKNTDSGTSFSNFAALCRKDYDEEKARQVNVCELAKVIVTYKLKE